MAFSTPPFCQGARGSQKNASMPVMERRSVDGRPLSIPVSAAATGSAFRLVWRRAMVGREQRSCATRMACPGALNSMASASPWPGCSRLAMAAGRSWIELDTRKNLVILASAAAVCGSGVKIGLARA